MPVDREHTPAYELDVCKYCAGSIYWHNETGEFRHYTMMMLGHSAMPDLTVTCKGYTRDQLVGWAEDHGITGPYRWRWYPPWVLRRAITKAITPKE